MSAVKTSMYRYDALDLLIELQPADQEKLTRIYRGEHLVTQLQGQKNHSVFQHDTQLLALLALESEEFDSQLLVTDQQRSVLQHAKVRQVYTPHGHHRLASGPGSLLGFNGEVVDPVTGHYLLGNGHRAFNPVLMRFNSPDRLSPFGRGGLNPYTYCLGDPVNYRDPTGREAWQPWMFVVLGALSIVTAGFGVFSAGMSVAALKTARVPGSAILSKRAVYSGAVGTVSGLIGAGIGTVRSVMNATNPDNSAQDPLLIALAGLSLFSLGASVSSTTYSFRAYKLNRASARGAAMRKTGPFKDRLATPESFEPSAPPPTPDTIQQPANVQTPAPIGFEQYTSPQTRSPKFQFFKVQQDIQDANRIRRNSL